VTRLSHRQYADTPAGVRLFLADETDLGVGRAMGLGDACMVSDPVVVGVWAVRAPEMTRDQPERGFIVYLFGPSAVWGPDHYGPPDFEEAEFPQWPPRSTYP